MHTHSLTSRPRPVPCIPSRTGVTSAAIGAVIVVVIVLVLSGPALSSAIEVAAEAATAVTALAVLTGNERERRMRRDLATTSWR